MKKEAFVLIKKATAIIKESEKKPLKERVDMLEQSLAILIEANRKLD